MHSAHCLARLPSLNQHHFPGTVSMRRLSARSANQAHRLCKCSAFFPDAKGETHFPVRQLPAAIGAPSAEKTSLPPAPGKSARACPHQFFVENACRLRRRGTSFRPWASWSRA
jgi:hypothetical protein